MAGPWPPGRSLNTRNRLDLFVSAICSLLLQCYYFFIIILEFITTFPMPSNPVHRMYVARCSPRNFIVNGDNKIQPFDLSSTQP